MINHRSVTFVFPLPNAVRIPDGYPIDFIQPDAGDDDDAIKMIKDGVSLKLKERIIFRTTESYSDRRAMEASIVVSNNLMGRTAPKNTNGLRLIKGKSSVALVSIIISKRDVDQEELTALFERGLKLLRTYLKSYYLVDREPIELPSRMNLPSAITVHIEDISSGRHAPKVGRYIEQQLFLLNTKRDKFISNSNSLSAEKLASVLHTDTMSGASVNNPTLDTYREASLAFERGEMIAASILYASSVEVFLDTVLLYLFWEEGMRPEDAYIQMFETKMCSCVDCRSRMVTTLDRVTKGLYQDRIGGDWSKSSLLMKLWREVAEIRNKVAHTGVEPDSTTVTRFTTIVPEIQKIVTDYLIASIARYPLAAYYFAGQDGLERRGMSTDLGDYIPDEDYKPNSLSVPFVNWKFELERMGSKKLRRTEDSKCQLAVLLHPDGEVRWINYDSEAKLFRLLVDQEPKEGTKKYLEEIRLKASEEEIPQSIIVNIMNLKPNLKTHNISWYPMYLLSSSLHTIDSKPMSYRVPEK